MALRVWLPLNRDLRNLGTDNTQTWQITNPSVVTLNNYCYNFSGYTGYGISNGSGNSLNSTAFFEKYIDNHPFSISIRINTDATLTGDGNGLITLGYGITLRISASGFAVFSITGKDPNNPDASNVYINNYVFSSGFIVNDGKWHVLIATYDYDVNKMSLYVDGELKSTAIFNSTYKFIPKWKNTITIGRDVNASTQTNRYFYQGSLYDFRFYDHALSKKEVVELSRGCILHYPCNDVNNQLLVNVFKYPVFTDDDFTVSGNWKHWAYSSSTITSIGTYSQNQVKSYIYNKTRKYSHKISCTSGSRYLLYQSDNEIPFEGGYRSAQAIIKMEDGSVPDETKIYWTWNGNVGTRPKTQYIPFGDGFYLMKCEGFYQDGSNNMVGIYITVNNTAYISEAYLENNRQVCSKLGNFYKEYEYLQSDGTAYINTGILYDSNKTTYRIECEFSQPSNMGRYDAVFGAYGGESNKTIRIIRLDSNSKMGVYYNNQAGNTSNRVELTTSNTNRKKIVMTSSEIRVTENGVTRRYDTPTPSGSRTTGKPFCLFTESTTSSKSCSRIYNFRLYDGNELLIDYIPVEYNGEYGMWDLVSNTFQGNSDSSGTFNVGSLVKGVYLKDVSGFDNHSLITGTLPLVTTEPKPARYNKCMDIIPNNYANGAINAPQVKSASFWIYIGDENPKSQIVFVDLASHLGFGFTSTGYIIAHTSNNTSIPCKYSVGNTIKNSWNYFVINHLGTSVEVYLNGTKLSNPSSEYWANSTSGFYLGARFRNNSLSNYYNGKLSDFRLFSNLLTQSDVDVLYSDGLAIDKSQNIHTYEINEEYSNILQKEEFGIATKQWLNGLTFYNQTNCQCTLTDEGYRIYRTSGVTYDTSDDSTRTMWGGFVLKNTDNMYNLQKGHTYVIQFDVKGRTYNHVQDIFWGNLVGNPGGGLEPNPSDVKTINPVTANYQSDEWKTFTYKWTINDDVWKVCTSSYTQGFVAGETYVSYRDFKYGFTYSNTGSGTELYIKNLRMYDITSNKTIDIKKNGVLKIGELIEYDGDSKFLSNGVVECNKLTEL